MKNIVVVDSSVVIKWILNEPDSHIAEKLLDEWIDKETIVLAPTLLIYEITNVIYKHVQKGNIPLDGAKKALTNFSETEITFTNLQERSFIQRVTELAYQFDLPATYDAYFLVLAEHENCELWTADARLWKAVKGELSWVRLLRNYRASGTKQ